MNITRDEATGRPTSLNGMAQYVHFLNAKWWVDPATNMPIQRNHGQMRMLMISEVAEAMEGERKNLMDDKLPHRRMAEVEIADVVIRLFDYAGGWGYNLEDFGHLEIQGVFQTFSPDTDKGQMLECLCRDIVIIGVSTKAKDASRGLSILLRNCEEYCRLLGYDLWGAVFDKLEYNKTREDHKAEARLAAGGKAW